LSHQVRLVQAAPISARPTNTQWLGAFSRQAMISLIPPLPDRALQRPLWMAWSGRRPAAPRSPMALDHLTSGLNDSLKRCGSFIQASRLASKA